MNKRVYIKDWLELKPYDKQAPTDGYYLRICNEVIKAITASNQYFALEMYLEKTGLNNFACFLTSYFEDIISNTNIWKTFVKTHQRMYKKELPFYDLEAYNHEEINHQDVSFLIWYYINSVQDEKFISPFSDFIPYIAKQVMDIFDNAWEYAPENEYLKLFYRIDKNEEDFYVARNLISTILFGTYLFKPDTFVKLVESELEIIEENVDEEEITMLLNENIDNRLHNSRTCLLSLKGKEWAVEILGENHKLCKDFLNMSQKNHLFLFLQRTR